MNYNTQTIAHKICAGSEPIRETRVIKDFRNQIQNTNVKKNFLRMVNAVLVNDSQDVWEFRIDPFQRLAAQRRFWAIPSAGKWLDFSKNIHTRRGIVQVTFRKVPVRDSRAQRNLL